jgi:hypothetical protein
MIKSDIGGKILSILKRHGDDHSLKLQLIKLEMIET